MTVASDLARALADIPAGAREVRLLAAYLERLLARNATMNLTAARTAEALAGHVRDSLEIARYVREPLVDVGSGGGFPGIPLAIVTGFRTTLVESVAKKAAFLREVAEALDLPVTVLARRAEDAGRDPALRAAFGSATARAVASVSTVLELTIPLLAVGGVAVLQRGGLEPAERFAAGDAALVLGASVEAELPADGEAGWDAASPPATGRRVLLVRKIAATGPRFPRRAGIPAKRPLCVEPVSGHR